MMQAINEIKTRISAKYPELSMSVILKTKYAVKYGITYSTKCKDATLRGIDGFLKQLVNKKAKKVPKSSKANKVVVLSNFITQSSEIIEISTCSTYVGKYQLVMTIPIIQKCLDLTVPFKADPIDRAHENWSVVSKDQPYHLMVSKERVGSIRTSEEYIKFNNIDSCSLRNFESEYRRRNKKCSIYENPNGLPKRIRYFVDIDADKSRHDIESLCNKIQVVLIEVFCKPCETISYQLIQSTKGRSHVLFNLAVLCDDVRPLTEHVISKIGRNGIDKAACGLRSIGQPKLEKVYYVNTIGSDIVINKNTGKTYSKLPHYERFESRDEAQNVSVLVTVAETTNNEELKDYCLEQLCLEPSDMILTPLYKADKKLCKKSDGVIETYEYDYTNMYWPDIQVYQSELRGGLPVMKTFKDSDYINHKTIDLKWVPWVYSIYNTSECRVADMQHLKEVVGVWEKTGNLWNIDELVKGQSDNNMWDVPEIPEIKHSITGEIKGMEGIKSRVFGRTIIILGKPKIIDLRFVQWIFHNTPDSSTARSGCNSFWKKMTIMANSFQYMYEGDYPNKEIISLKKRNEKIEKAWDDWSRRDTVHGHYKPDRNREIKDFLIESHMDHIGVQKHIEGMLFQKKTRGLVFKLMGVKKVDWSFKNPQPIQDYFNSPRSKFVNHMKHTSEFIADHNMNGDFKTLCIKSPMGTGKTQKMYKLIKEYKDQGKSVLVIVPRVALKDEELDHLIKEGIADMTWDYMNKDELKKTNNKYMQKHLFLCINSVHRVGRMYDLLILDESDMIMSQFSMKEFELKNKTMDVFFWLCKNAKKILCIDAHMSHRTLNVISHFGQVRLEENLYKTRSDHKIFGYETQDDLLNKMYSLILKDKNIAFCFDSATRCEVFTKAIAKKDLKSGRETKVGVVKGDCTAEFKKDFAKNRMIDGVPLNQFQVLMYTQSIGAGVSIIPTQWHCDYMFGYFKGESSGVEDTIQMLGRVRSIESKEVHLCLEESNKFAFTGIEDIYWKIKQSIDQLNTHPTGENEKYNAGKDFSLIDLGIVTVGQNIDIDRTCPKYSLVEAIHYNNAQSVMHFIDRVAAYLIEAGYQWMGMATKTCKDEDIKVASKEVKDKRELTIIDAPVIDRDGYIFLSTQAEEIKKKGQEVPKDLSIKMKKYEIMSDMKISQDELAQSNVTDDKKIPDLITKLVEVQSKVSSINSIDHHETVLHKGKDNERTITGIESYLREKLNKPVNYKKIEVADAFLEGDDFDDKVNSIDWGNSLNNENKQKKFLASLLLGKLGFKAIHSGEVIKRDVLETNMSRIMKELKKSNGEDRLRVLFNDRTPLYSDNTRIDFKLAYFNKKIGEVLGCEMKSLHSITGVNGPTNRNTFKLVVNDKITKLNETFDFLNKNKKTAESPITKQVIHIIEEPIIKKVLVKESSCYNNGWELNDDDMINIIRKNGNYDQYSIEASKIDGPISNKNKIESINKRNDLNYKKHVKLIEKYAR